MRSSNTDHVTTWRNPLDQTVRLSFHRNNGRGEKRVKFVIEPGQEVPIPGEYDAAIHHVHNGVVVGGMAPFLVKAGERALPVVRTLSAPQAEAASGKAVPLDEVERRLSEMEERFNGYATQMGSDIERERTARLAAEAETARLRAMLEQATAPAATTKGAKPVPVAAPKGDSALPTS